MSQTVMMCAWLWSACWSWDAECSAVAYDKFEQCRPVRRCFETWSHLCDRDWVPPKETRRKRSK